MKLTPLILAAAIATDAMAGTGMAQVSIQGTIANDVTMNVLAPINFGTIPVSNSSSVKASTSVVFTSGASATPTVYPDTPGSPDWNLNGGYSKNVATGGGRVRLSLSLNNIPLNISGVSLPLNGGSQTMPLEATLSNESGFTGVINAITTLYIAY